MKKALKWTLIVVAALVLLMVALFPVMQNQTKKASPEATATATIGSATVEVKYCQPSKRDRVIFGELVPYGEVWRTGANEATTFTTSADLSVNGTILPAGTYTLWTIPGQQEWTVIWNSESYGWGVSFGGKASRDPEFDALQVKVPSEALPATVEMFTIALDGSGMTLSWDQTQVKVPMGI